MRRLAGILLVGAVCAALALAGTGAGGDGPARYFVELDNAFGLVKGGDLKVAGVRAGTVERISLERRRMRARVEIAITDRGFGDLRADASCEVRPQSLLGEYFLDCRPGTDPRRLERGGTIPVERTSSTIPLDLVQNIMRRPYRERFSIFLSELGAGLAARGDDLNETIRRANPALRETDRVLEALAEEREVIRDLYRDADTVLARLVERKEDVTEFIAEARDTSRASAVADKELARTFELLPTLLQELDPTMDRLREAAAAQRPALVQLGDQAPVLTRLLDSLGPFADASRPAVRALARAAREGRPTVRDAAGPVRTLRRAVRPLPEVTTNLAFMLQHLDDPKFAVEKDERAGFGPDGGMTGLRALLRYFWAQSQALNVHDANSYNLKVSLFVDRVCGAYANAAIAKDEANVRCRAWLGPNQPGVTTPDPTATTPGRRAGAKRREKARRPERDARPAEQAPARAGEREPDGPAAKPEKPLPDLLQELLDEALPADPLDPQIDPLLDFLMGP